MLVVVVPVCACTYALLPECERDVSVSWAWLRHLSVRVTWWSCCTAVLTVSCPLRLSVRVSPSPGGGVAYPSVSCDVVVCYVVSCRAVLCRVLWVSTRRGMRVFARGYVVSFRT